MAWFRKEKQDKLAPESFGKKIKIPEGLWIKCDNCKEVIYRKEVDKNFKICPKCDYHFRISASERLPYLVDEGSFLEVEDGLSPKDFLGFKDYKDKLKSSRKKTGLKEPAHGLHTFPSWSPLRNIDHILVSSPLHVEEAEVLQWPFSDHLPMTARIALREKTAVPAMEGLSLSA